MEKVTVKTKNPLYTGFIRGFRFTHGVAVDVPRKDAEAMKEFGVEIVGAELAEKADAPKPVKRSPRKKKGE